MSSEPHACRASRSHRGGRWHLAGRLWGIGVWIGHSVPHPHRVYLGGLFASALLEVVLWPVAQRPVNHRGKPGGGAVLCAHQSPLPRERCCYSLPPSLRGRGLGGLFEPQNFEQGMSKAEVLPLQSQSRPTSSFEIPCSKFDIRGRRRGIVVGRLTRSPHPGPLPRALSKLVFVSRPGGERALRGPRSRQGHRVCHRRPCPE